MGVANRFYGFNVGILKLSTEDGLGAPTTPVYDFHKIFTDCTLDLEYENDTSKAAFDINDIYDSRSNAAGQDGFEVAVNKARGYSIKLGAAVGTAAGVANRSFGWNMTSLTIGGAAAPISQYKSVKVSISKETTENRATYDSAPLGDGGLDGWRYPVIKGKKIMVDIEAVVEGNPSGTPVTADIFEQAITSWAPDAGDAGAAYSVVGGGVTVAGTGVISAGSLNFPTDGANQHLQIAGRGRPTSHANTGDANLLYLAFSDANFIVQITRPGGVNYYGSVYVTEAELERPDGAALQNGTLLGYGPLLLATP